MRKQVPEVLYVLRQSVDGVWDVQQIDPSYLKGAALRTVRRCIVADGVINSSMKRIVKFLDQMDEARS